MSTLLLYAALAIGVSFLCSLLEAAFLSTPTNYPSMLRSNGKNKLADKLEKLKLDVDSSLSSILTLNTIAHTAGAAGVGAAATTLWGNTVLSIVSAIMTFAILVFSEIIPKTLGANQWRLFVPFVVPTLTLFNMVLKPFNKLLSLFTRFMSKPTENGDLATELKILTQLAYEDNAINDDTKKIILNALNLSKYKAEDVMTPESVVKCLDGNMTIEEFYNTNHLVFSRYPVYIDEKEDDIFIGFIHKSDLFNSDETESPISTLINDLQEFEPDVNIELVMHHMLINNLHMASVRDKFGTFRGIITLEDIIERILGKEIKDETDSVINLRKSAAKRMKMNKQKALKLGTR